MGSKTELDDKNKILLPPLAYETRTVLAGQPELGMPLLDEKQKDFYHSV